MSKYVVLDGHTASGADFGIEANILKAHGIDSVIAECRSNEDIAKAASDADAVGIIYSKINGAVMDLLKKCRVLVRYGIGYDNIAVQDATRRGIAVCNIPDYCQADVATHAFGLILDCCRKITLLDRRLHSGIWNDNYGYRINRLSGLTLGIIGFGNIGRKLVEYTKPYNMETYVYDPYLEEEVFLKFGVKQAGFDELLAKSDIISVHCPLTGETNHLINRESIAKMKDGVIFINTARGGIVSLDDITAALKSGKVKAAGIDVLESEPDVQMDHAIFSCENAILTPHCAYNSVEAVIEQHEKIAKTVIDVLGGNVPYNCINKNDLQNRQR